VVAQNSYKYLEILVYCKYYMLNQHKSYIIFKIVYERVSKNDLGLSGSERPRVMQINMKPIQFVHFDVLHFSL